MSPSSRGLQSFLCALLGTAIFVHGQTFRPQIPKAWDAEALHSMELPLVGLGQAATQLPPDDYYRMTPRVIYRTYPFYAPGKEPAGYYEALLAKEPEIAFRLDDLKTESDWIQAGEAVFFSAAPPTYPNLRDPAVFERLKLPTGANGVMPFYRYLIEKKGTVEIRAMTCASCHVRVLPDGSIVSGAQGNIVDLTSSGRATRVLDAIRRDERAFDVERRRAFTAFSVPWLKPDPAAYLLRISIEDYAAAREQIVPGVVARTATSLAYPPRTPDLIGLKDRKYFDSTGLIQHRSIGDLMRYAALADGMVNFATYGEQPPLVSFDSSRRTRLTDEQLYALALYLYSLRPPPNPNPTSDLARRGEKVFERAGCAGCHAPPLYTNNRLTPASGFSPPEDHRNKYDIMPVCIGTDSRLALQSRKATGYYKVPSLKGVWYRGPLEHGGSVLTLEDWLNPVRLKDDYVPTGFRGVSKTRAVAGHEFGLKLEPKDKEALIAFLKTL